MPDSTHATLALHGGTPAIGDDVTFHPWPPHDQSDEQLVLASLRGSSHAFGPHCTQLQNEFAAWNGNQYCAATNSGTAALHMGVAACDIGAGDEVIVTALSWTSSATCILHHNAIPIFVDIDWPSMHLDPAKIEAAITEKTKGILVVHYWGMCADMDPILEIARKHNLAVIEDACQAHGATYKGRRAGTMGDVAAFSLNQNKPLSAGEGGLFVTDDEQKHRKGRQLMNFGEMGAPDGDRDFHAHGMGWMYRGSDLPAAYALAQLRRIDDNNAKARENWRRLHDGLEGTPHLERMLDSPDRPTNGYAYVLRTAPDYVAQRGVSHSAMRSAVAQALQAEGLKVTPARWMLPAHTVFQARNGYGHGSPWTDGHSRPGITYRVEDYPLAQRAGESAIWIGVNSHRPPNGPAQVDAVVRAVRKVYHQLDELPLETEQKTAAAG